MANKKKLVGPTADDPGDKPKKKQPPTNFTDLVGEMFRAQKLARQASLFQPNELRKLTKEDLEEIADEDLEPEFYVERELYKMLGPIKKYRLLRDGDRDLLFAGWHLSRGERQGSPDKTVVDVYLTISEKFIIHVMRVRGEQMQVQSASAGIIPVIIVPDLEEKPPQVDVSGIEDVLKWMKSETHGALGPASKMAWEAACKKLPWIADLEVEEV